MAQIFGQHFRPEASAQSIDRLGRRTSRVQDVARPDTDGSPVAGKIVPVLRGKRWKNDPRRRPKARAERLGQGLGFCQRPKPISGGGSWGRVQSEKGA